MSKPRAVWVKCPGEAHRNPMIDNCMVCLPQWGKWPVCHRCARSLTEGGFCKSCRIYHTMKWQGYDEDLITTEELNRRRKS